jgi:hypothetical protein
LLDVLCDYTDALRSLDNVVKTAISLSKLSEGEASIVLELSLELKGEVNEHAVKMALGEVHKRLAGLAVGDVQRDTFVSIEPPGQTNEMRPTCPLRFTDSTKPISKPKEHEASEELGWSIYKYR